MSHTIRKELLERPVHVSVIGCGGSGSAIAAGLPLLHQSLLAYGHPGGLEVTLIDGDRVSESNCVRQPFSVQEIGQFKASVLATRINCFYGLRWKSRERHLEAGSLLPAADILIGCVDTRNGRRQIADYLDRIPGTSYWLDLGNSATSGQFILGEPANQKRPRANRLPTAAERFPEMIDSRLDSGDGPSCSAVEALERQAPFVNQVLASHSLALLAQLFRHGVISHAGGFINICNGHLAPIY